MRQVDKFPDLQPHPLHDDTCLRFLGISSENQASLHTANTPLSEWGELWVEKLGLTTHPRVEPLKAVHKYLSHRLQMLFTLIYSRKVKRLLALELSPKFTILPPPPPTPKLLFERPKIR